MKDVTKLFVVVLTFQIGRASVKPHSGHCAGTRCFTLFQESFDYRTAQDECVEQGGHLMTVRTPESQDVLLVLLGNFTGRFWIGLHLPAGCPDPAAELRGYQWVTADSQSDFSNWAPGFDSSCSSHRCVSVSQEDGFKWVQEPCDDRAAGFLCEYSFTEPCQSLVEAQGESVTYTTPLGFEAKNVLSLPPGTTAIQMPAETKYVCFSQQWLQAPWSCEIHEGGCEYKCAVDSKDAPSCYCPLGQAVNPANQVTCEVAKDDPCVSLRCAHACYEDGGAYKCTCDQGFKLAPDGRSCVDFNDCTDERQCPGENFRCINTVGGYQCVCEEGYRMAGGLCVDVNECMSAPCEHMCTNTPGSYNCSCFDGYKEDPQAPNKCKLHCGEEECVAECDPNDRFQCYCPDGYVSEERVGHTVCIDMDECSFFYCDQNCENTFGGYVCSCAAGYTLVGEYSCVKDEGGTDMDMDTDTAETASPSTPTVPLMPHPDPTRQPRGVTVGGLVGIILCTVFFIVLVVFLAHHFLSRRQKMDSADELKAPEEHGLRHVTHEA